MLKQGSNSVLNLEKAVAPFKMSLDLLEMFLYPMTQASALDMHLSPKLKPLY